MRCVDANVLVTAHRPQLEGHEETRDWLDRARVAEEPLGLADNVLAGFLRIVTHPRVFARPTPVGKALEFCDSLMRSPAAIRVSPGRRHWEIFAQLVNDAGSRGNQVPDAYLAALVIELGATWITADRGFGRYPGLRWQHPLDS